MSQLSKDEVGHNLIKIFSKDISTKTYFPRWCELGSFLTQKVKVLHAMDKLDNLMFEKLCNRKAIKPGIVAKNRKMVEDAYSAFYKGPQTLLCELVKKDVTHLLSDILTENEEKFLFETTPGETQQKSVIAVNPTKEVDTRKHVPTY